MSPEKQRIAIAGMYGWTRCQSLHQDGLRDEVYGLPPGATPVSENYCYLPGYLDDRNAMTEALRSLPREAQPVFFQHLNHAGVYGEWDILTADCKVQAEAFLRTLNLWEDEAP
jgi:hypothetical protein